jgi:gas vesicle protein
MANKNQELTYHTNIVGILASMLIGGLAGAVTMLLLAPQSGKRTRMQIQEKGIELLDQATGMVEDAVAQVRLDGNKIAREGRRKTNKLLHQGQNLLADQFEHVTDAVKAGKKAIQSASD